MSSAPQARPRELGDQMVRVGHKRGASLRDLYVLFLRAKWRYVLAFFALVYLTINSVFALAYLAVGDCITGARPGSFADAFFFSVHTVGTIGYGTMAPAGMCGNALVTGESFVSILIVALGTGLVFAKFSRPTSRVLFSRNAVIGKRNGVPTLTFRIANERDNSVVEASLKLTVLVRETTAEGESFRRLLDAPLRRGTSPAFILSWTAEHPIDEKSPLYGKTAEDLVAGDIRLIVTFTGIDAVLSQQVHASHGYWPEDILFGKRFVDIMSGLPDGRTQMDVSKFHDVIPAA